MTSDHVTWVECPGCGRPAAVGWLDGALVEFDCLSGCLFTPSEVRSAGSTHGWTPDTPVAPGFVAVLGAGGVAAAHEPGL